MPSTPSSLKYFRCSASSRDIAGKERFGGVEDLRRDHGFGLQRHVDGAVNLPLPELAGRVGELNGRPLAVVCASGYRSTVAASVLERSGFHRLYNVAGGMKAWIESGLPKEAT